MMHIKSESAWSFVTSSTGGLSVAFVAGQGGALYLRDPGGADTTVHYGAIGVGLSVGIKLPRVGKLQIRQQSVSGAVAPASFPNTGKIYVLGSASGNELTRADLTGPCVFVEAAAGVAIGGSASAMLLGLSSASLAALMLSGASPLVTPIAHQYMFDTAKALLMTAGVNVGIQAGAGVASYIGALF